MRETKHKYPDNKTMTPTMGARGLLLLSLLALVPFQSVEAYSPISTRKYGSLTLNTCGGKWRSDISQPPIHRGNVVLRMALEEEPTILTRGAVSAGMVAQPVVWTSLYFVATTGAGLPAGPFGLLGALEGVSYLVMLAFVGVSLYRKVTTGSGLPPGPSDLLGAAESLSYLSLLAGLLTLASLVVSQGCVPNAKPILDYSDYLPICQETPGIFGE